MACLALPSFKRVRAEAYPALLSPFGRLSLPARFEFPAAFLRGGSLHFRLIAPKARQLCPGVRASADFRRTDLGNGFVLFSFPEGGEDESEPEQSPSEANESQHVVVEHHLPAQDIPKEAVDKESKGDTGTCEGPSFTAGFELSQNQHLDVQDTPSSEGGGGTLERPSFATQRLSHFRKSSPIPGAKAREQRMREMAVALDKTIALPVVPENKPVPAVARPPSRFVKLSPVSGALKRVQCLDVQQRRRQRFFQSMRESSRFKRRSALLDHRVRQLRKATDAAACLESVETPSVPVPPTVPRPPSHFVKRSAVRDFIARRMHRMQLGFLEPPTPSKHTPRPLRVPSAFAKQSPVQAWQERQQAMPAMPPSDFMVQQPVKPTRARRKGSKGSTPAEAGPLSLDSLEETGLLSRRDSINNGSPRSTKVRRRRQQPTPMEEPESAVDVEPALPVLPVSPSPTVPRLSSRFVKHSPIAAARERMKLALIPRRSIRLPGRIRSEFRKQSPVAASRQRGGAGNTIRPVLSATSKTAPMVVQPPTVLEASVNLGSPASLLDSLSLEVEGKLPVAGLAAEHPSDGSVAAEATILAGVDVAEKPIGRSRRRVGKKRRGKRAVQDSGVVTEGKEALGGSDSEERPDADKEALEGSDSDEWPDSDKETGAGPDSDKERVKSEEGVGEGPPLAGTTAVPLSAVVTEQAAVLEQTGGSSSESSDDEATSGDSAPKRLPSRFRKRRREIPSSVGRTPLSELPIQPEPNGVVIHNRIPIAQPLAVQTPALMEGWSEADSAADGLPPNTSFQAPEGLVSPVDEDLVRYASESRESEEVIKMEIKVIDFEVNISAESSDGEVAFLSETAGMQPEGLVDESGENVADVSPLVGMESDAWTEDSLSAMKVAELRESAKSLGLKGFSKLKKAELVQLLLNHSQGQCS